MKYIIYLLALIVLFSLNIGFFSQFQLLGAGPNLLLILVIVFSLDKNDSGDFLLLAFFAGLLLDFYNGLAVGSFTLGLLFLALLLHLLAEKIVVYDLNWKYLAAVTVAATAALQAFLWLYGFIFAALGWFPYYPIWQNLARVLLPQIIYNLVLLYPVYILSTRLKSWAEAMDVKQHRVI